MLKQEFLNKYNFISDESDGLRAVRVGNKWGFINNLDKLVIDTIYDKVGTFTNGFCKVKEYGKIGWNIINKRGIVVSKDYNKIGEILEGFNNMRIVSIINKDILMDNYGLIFNNGKEILLPSYINIVKIGKYLKLENSNKIPILVNNKGERAIPPMYTDIKEEVSNGNIVVSFDFYYGMIKPNGEIIISFMFQEYLGKKGNLYVYKLYNTLYYFDEDGFLKKKEKKT